MDSEKVIQHMDRMKSLRSSEKIPCPYCGNGMIRKQNDAVFLCDSCGKGIVGRVNIDR